MTDATIVGTRVGVSDAVSRVDTGLFIDGEWVESTTGERFEVVAPATEEVVATVANGNADDAGVPSRPVLACRSTGRRPLRANAA